MKCILILMLILFTGSAAAQTTNEQLQTKIASMSDTEKAELLERINQSQPTTVDTTNQWLDIGERMGRGLAATAREMGVAVNEFANTPVGKLTALLLLWNFMGDDIAKIVTSLFSTLIFLPTWLIICRRLFGEFNSEGEIVGYDLSQQRWGEGVAPFLMLILFIGIISLATFPVLSI